LFVAVDPPPSVRQELVAWARGAVASVGLSAAKRSRGPVRLLEAESLHLTLCFLGSRPVEEIGELALALGSCTEEVGELSVGAPLWLPPRHPRVLAVEVHDRSGALGRLHDAVTQALSGVSDWEPQRRRFRAHVTLARLREGARIRGGPPALSATPQLRFTPGALVLYRSWLDPAGASYEELTSVPLRPLVS
jgi:2'-5' RNA ligase